MMKFKESRDSIASDLLLWQETPTQIAIQHMYNLKVHPISSLYNESTINFDIPSQPRGMLSNIEIITSFRVKKGTASLGSTDECSIVNNFANALYELVDVKVSDRVDLMQSMRNSYAYQTLFDYCLNSDKNREDYLFCTQLFKMDSGDTKADSEKMVFKGNEVKNHGAAERAKRIRNSQLLTVSSRLHCPLITTTKALPTNLNIRVSLTKNTDKFLLMADSDEYRVQIENVFLDITFIRPHEVFHSMIEERLLKQPAPYFITKPELIIKPIAQSGRIVRLNQIFPGKLPKHAFFCVLRSSDFEGTFDSNPFTFIPFGKFQLTVNGTPYFNDPLEIKHVTENSQKIYKENWNFLQQLYRTIGKEGRGCGLIDSKNFQQNFMVGISLTGDRSSATANYLSPQAEASTQLELDFGYEINVQSDLILLVYAVYDRVIKINANREIEIIE